MAEDSDTVIEEIKSTKVETHKGLLGKDGRVWLRGKTVMNFARYPNTDVVYKTRGGEVDKTTVILLDKDGNPLEN